MADDDNSPRLKWDEANLYLTEQERTAKMKIDEPKTPYAPHYDPAEDDEAMRIEDARNALIDAHDIVVDDIDIRTSDICWKVWVSVWVSFSERESCRRSWSG